MLFRSSYIRRGFSSGEHGWGAVGGKCVLVRHALMGQHKYQVSKYSRIYGSHHICHVQVASSSAKLARGRGHATGRLKRRCALAPPRTIHLSAARRIAPKLRKSRWRGAHFERERHHRILESASAQRAQQRRSMSTAPRQAILASPCLRSSL